MKFNAPLREYTLMPTRMGGFFADKQLQTWQMKTGSVKSGGFTFTKGQRVMEANVE